jgi:hypothetical protein
MAKNSTFSWWFRNRETGKIMIGQSPNLPIKIVQATTLVGVLLPKSPLRTWLGAIAALSLTWWAVDEVARGVNPARRLTGGIALAGLVVLTVRGSRRPKKKRKRRS